MIQKHKEKERGEDSSLDNLRDKLQNIKNSEVSNGLGIGAKPQDLETEIIEHIDTSDREVMLKIKAESCGCGGGGDDFIDIKRLVPYDSPLNDGDIVSNYEEADEIW